VGTLKRSTGRKVAGSRPDEVNLFNLPNLSCALDPEVYTASNRNQYQKQKNNLNYWVMHPVARVSINIVYRNTIKRAPTFVAYGGFYILLAVPGHALLWPFPVTD
jgi:hypothetical protein